MNGMSIFNLNDDIPTKYITCDVANCLLLRQDLHTSFDSKHFVFVPKLNSWRIHFLTTTADYGRLLHNRKPLALQVSPRFLYARFAWAIISRVKTFAELPGVKVRVRVDGGQWQDSIIPSDVLRVGIGPPAKRRRRDADADAEDGSPQDNGSAFDAQDEVQTTLPTGVADEWKWSALSTVAGRLPKQFIFDTLVAQSPHSWNTLTWHPDSERLKLVRDTYLKEHEPVLHAREVRRQLDVLEEGGILWDDESDSGDSWGLT